MGNQKAAVEAVSAESVVERRGCLPPLCVDLHPEKKIPAFHYNKFSGKNKALRQIHTHFFRWEEEKGGDRKNANLLFCVFSI